jgi:lipopolysaccharide biosynthesis glycosyltransferase
MAAVDARVFVGVDRSQAIPAEVLRHSIQRRTRLRVEVTPMHDLDLPEPRDIRQGKRTPFSFSRFAIPALAGRAGSAVYMDADMIVLKDIAELVSIPFDGAKVVIQEDLPEQRRRSTKRGAPRERIKQTAVMLLDCAALDWDAVEIIAGLDGKYTYEQLLMELCILRERDIRYAIPFRWNSLEHWDESTALLHYTDMLTQPWVDPRNANGHLWVREVRTMIDEGALAWSRIDEDIARGFLRPSLREELERDRGEPLGWWRARALARADRRAGFTKHSEVYARKLEREAAIRRYEEDLAASRDSALP